MRTGSMCVIGIPVMVASLLTAPVPACSLDDVLGWEGTSWGMTEPEVTTSMASRGFHLVAGRPDLGVPFVGNIPFHTKADIAGNDYDVAFRFSRRSRGLSAVLIGTLADSVDHAAALHDSLRGALTAQHGAATEVESRDRRNSLTRWVFETTTIVLHLDSAIDVRGHRISQVSAVYMPSMRSDQREANEEVLLFLLLQMFGKGRR